MKSYIVNAEVPENNIFDNVTQSTKVTFKSKNGGTIRETNFRDAGTTIFEDNGTKENEVTKSTADQQPTAIGSHVVGATTTRNGTVKTESNIVNVDPKTYTESIQTILDFFATESTSIYTKSTEESISFFGSFLTTRKSFTTDSETFQTQKSFFSTSKKTKTYNPFEKEITESGIDYYAEDGELLITLDDSFFKTSENLQNNQSSGNPLLQSFETAGTYTRVTSTPLDDSDKWSSEEIEDTSMTISPDGDDTTISITNDLSRTRIPNKQLNGGLLPAEGDGLFLNYEEYRGGQEIKIFENSYAVFDLDDDKYYETAEINWGADSSNFPDTDSIYTGDFSHLGNFIYMPVLYPEPVNRSGAKVSFGNNTSDEISATAGGKSFTGFWDLQGINPNTKTINDNNFTIKPVEFINSPFIQESDIKDIRIFRSADDEISPTLYAYYKDKYYTNTEITFTYEYMWYGQLNITTEKTDPNANAGDSGTIARTIVSSDFTSDFIFSFTSQTNTNGYGEFLSRGDVRIPFSIREGKPATTLVFPIKPFGQAGNEPQFNV